MYGLTIYSDKELKKIQQIEQDALKEIIRVCESLSIEYFLIDGAALGAIRHNGFIPWDDDIDVGMTRENYRRFLQEAPSVLSEQYYLQTPYLGKQNPYFYSKLRVNNTKFVEYCNRKLDMHHGVYIDICPFDEVPDDEKRNKKQFRRCQFLIHIFVLRQSPELSSEPTTWKRKILSLIRCGIHGILQLIPYRWIADAIEKETTKYNGTGQAAYSFLHYPIRKKDYIYKNELYELKKHDFNGIEVSIPNNCDAYLRRHYGDYMKWPDEEKRYGHKPYRIEL